MDAARSLDAFRDVTDPAAIARAGLFVAEGRLVVRRLLASSRFTTRAVLVTRAAHAALRDVIPAGLPCHVVDQATLDSLVRFNMHRGCLALAERPPVPSLDDISLAGVERAIVLEGVNNPDNVGGIFRSAAAFDAHLVVLGPGCGDPFYRKAVRTSMAATLDVPFAAAARWPAALDTLRSQGFRVLALTPDAPTLLDAVRPEGSRVALLVGTEGAGLTDAARAAADVRVRIRSSDRVDSLNVTVAASIAMHHLFRA